MATNTTLSLWNSTREGVEENPRPAVPFHPTEVIFHLQCVDDTGRVVPHEETGLPTTILKAASVEIQAESQDGFDESLQRTVKENSNVLGFGAAEFED